MPEPFPPYIPHWIGWTCSVGVLLVALGVIYRFAKGAWRFGRRMVSALLQAEESYPVLMAISREFSKNGGTSLRDAIDRIDAKADAAVADAAASRKEVAASRQAVEANGKHVESIGKLLAGLHGAELDMLGNLTVGHQEIKEAIKTAGNGGAKP